jgi:hypothetical protein
MEKSDLEPDFKPFESKKIAIAIGLFGVLITQLFWYFGDQGRGRAASILIIGIVLIVGVFWKFTRQRWFLITIAGLVCLDTLIVWAIPWPDEHYNAVALMPIAVFNLVLNYGAVQLAGKFMAPNSPD